MFGRENYSSSKGRARSTDLGSLPKVTESKEEDYNERQQKMIFHRKLNTLIDLSEKRPSSGSQVYNRGASGIAIDCLTIEEEEAEDVQIEPLELFSNDNESSKISSPISKPLSKKLIKVDEVSIDTEERNWRKFETDIDPIIEEKAIEEEEPANKSQIDGSSKILRQSRRDSLAKIVRAELVTQQDSEILKILDPKEDKQQVHLEEEISEEEPTTEA